MNTEELKLIVELFAKVTDGALIGGVTYLLLNFLQAIVPYAIGAWCFGKLINKLPKVIRIKEES